LLHKRNKNYLEQAQVALVINHQTISKCSATALNIQFELQCLFSQSVATAPAQTEVKFDIFLVQPVIQAVEN